MSNSAHNLEAINLFVDRLVAEKKFENVDVEVLGQIKEDLIDRVNDRLDMVLLAQIPEDKLPEFEALLDMADRQKIQEFCQKNIVDLENILAKELMEFRLTYLNA